MSIFDKILKDSESVFKNEVALSYEFVPKEIPYRETQQQVIASCIAPLFSNRSGRNLIIHGPPGVGKTVATKKVLEELEEKTDDIVPIYINCWQKNTSYKIMLEICNIIEYRFTHNKKTDELFDVIKAKLNKYEIVFVFDEIDKAEDTDFLYWILTDILKKSVILLTNYKNTIAQLDTRIGSRLTPETIEFLPYNQKETQGILDMRRSLAFNDNVWNKNAFEQIIEKTVQLRDIRSGLYLLKESGQCAEEQASRTIQAAHVKKAIQKLDEFKVKNSEDLKDESKQILELIKKEKEAKIGELFKIYQEQGGTASYKTFQRRINKLAEGKFISVKRLQGGSEGNTSIIVYNTTLQDYA